MHTWGLCSTSSSSSATGPSSARKAALRSGAIWTCAVSWEHAALGQAHVQASRVSRKRRTHLGALLNEQLKQRHGALLGQEGSLALGGDLEVGCELGAGADEGRFACGCRGRAVHAQSATRGCPQHSHQTPDLRPCRLGCWPCAASDLIQRE